MRREGFEFSVSPPVVLYQQRPSGKHEPLEEVVCEVEDTHAGSVIEALSHRKVILPGSRLGRLAGTSKASERPLISGSG